MFDFKYGSLRLLMILLLIANGWAQSVLWFGSQGVVQWLQTENQLQITRKEMRQVEDRIRRLKQEIRLVDKEPMVLEEVARRYLGLVYPDEILFVFSSK